MTWGPNWPFRCLDNFVGILGQSSNIAQKRLEHLFLKQIILVLSFFNMIQNFVEKWRKELRMTKSMHQFWPFWDISKWSTRLHKAWIEKWKTIYKWNFKEKTLGMTNRLHRFWGWSRLHWGIVHHPNFEIFISLPSPSSPSSSSKQSILHFQAICSKIGLNPQIDFVARCNCL